MTLPEADISFKYSFHGRYLDMREVGECPNMIPADESRFHALSTSYSASRAELGGSIVMLFSCLNASSEHVRRTFQELSRLRKVQADNALEHE